MNAPRSLLIIGAGPFGLSLAVQARHLGIDSEVVGIPMEFWRQSMPPGMLLRSGIGWHLDPQDTHTIAAYLESHGVSPADAEPLPLGRYLDYAEWFRDKKGVEVRPNRVVRLDRKDVPTPHFVASLDDGTRILAENVVVATGFGGFEHIPEDLAALLPAGRYRHTRRVIHMEEFAGRRCLIVGGRQSAFESAALLRENGAAEVHVSHRHPTPRFEQSDWTWVDPLVDSMAEDPGYFRRLSVTERDALNRRFWEEGRMRLEPWLGPRIHRDGIRLWPETRIAACSEDVSGALEIELAGVSKSKSQRRRAGGSISVDEVIFATGYKVDMSRVPFLQAGNIGGELPVEGGFPLLDEYFQSGIPGLFFTSMPATRDFGAFFAFTVSARTSAKVIAAAVQDRQRIWSRDREFVPQALS